MSLYLDILLFSLIVISGIALVMAFRKIRALTLQHEGLIKELTSQVEANRNNSKKVLLLEQRFAALQTRPASETKTPKKQELKKEKIVKKPEFKPEKKSKAEESLWHDVIFLARQGLSADKIARDLSITRGEVELILGLHNFKPKENKL